MDSCIYFIIKQVDQSFLNIYYIVGTDHYGQDLETVEMDRLSFVIQRVSDILLEKTVINYEHLHTVEIIMNSFLQYLQRLKSSIPLGSVMTPPKMSMEITLLYGLSKLYVRSEPHVSVGLKILMPLLAKLRSEDKLINLNKLDITINIENNLHETDPGSIIPSNSNLNLNLNLNSSENLKNDMNIDEICIMDGDDNRVDVYSNKNSDNSSEMTLLQNVTEDIKAIEDIKNYDDNCIDNQCSDNDIIVTAELENKGVTVKKFRKYSKDEDQDIVEEERVAECAQNKEEFNKVEKEVEKHDDLNGKVEEGKRNINTFESDLQAADTRIIDQQTEKKEKNEKEEELKMKHEAQIFLLRQRLRIAEELTNIGKKTKKMNSITNCLKKISSCDVI